MRYSLLNRFQGGWLGSHIGDLIGREQVLLSAWSQIAIGTTESLIESGSIALEKNKVIDNKLWKLKNTASSSEAALATLPIALFFHESPSLLVEKLCQGVEVWQYCPEAPEAVLVWGTALALALREKLQIEQMVEQLLELVPTPSTLLVQQLEQVKICLQQRVSLQQAENRLSRCGEPGYLAIAKALYCFNSTPADFRLCVERAAQTEHQPQLTAALAGALSGVYNGLGAIPGQWRIASTRHNATKDSYQQAKRLYAAWSGVYQLENHDLDPAVAIASPLVMQKRASLKIISQEE